MDKISVEGGSRLYGRTVIGGMKNSALPVIYACLLIKDECIIENVPRVSDVENSLQILRGMGAYADFVGEHTVRIDASSVGGEIKDFPLVSKMRASSYLMGSLLSRFGEAHLPMPGGCNFGARPIEQHLKGFSYLGATCSEENGLITIKAKEKLKSAKITLDKISVGATINTVLASVLVDGETVIENVAREPHVIDLINFLNACGAKIVHLGSKIVIEGVKELHGIKYRIYPDMIESLTYMACVGVCGGEAELIGAEFSHISYVCDIFGKMGLEIKSDRERIIVKSRGNINGADVITAPYPLFPTDLHPQFAAMLCFANGGGTVTEEIFPGRFGYVAELWKMGAHIVREKNSVIISKSEMHAAELDATDLRAGAALIVASLGADGRSIVNNVGYIVRGYENIVGKISDLGGKIKFIKEI